MPDPIPLDELTARWQAAVLADPTATLEQFCADRPDRLDELRRHLQDLASMEAFLQSTGGPSRDTSAPAAGGGSPAAAVPGYELLEELGRGGMGVVYKARHVRLNRTVAVKMLLARGRPTPDQLGRFRTEAEAVAALQHPNIVQIFDVGEHDGQPYFSLEFVDGGSLDRLTRGGPVPPARAAELSEAVARAMAFAHTRGVVHRDLKPANVLLTADGAPKVTDFGLAKRLDDADGRLTRSGDVMGTPAYMAPEQARGDAREAGPAADVYALGAILYELLTGGPPFRGTSVMDTIQLVLFADPVPPSAVAPGVPRDLETVCLTCLAKEPGRRYSSALALAQDLERFRAGEPILARREGPVQRAWRKARRRPGVLAAVAAAVAAAGVAGWAAVEAGSARRAATLAREFDEGLGTAGMTAGRRDELAALARRLADHDPAAGAAAAKRLTDRAADDVRGVLRGPRVSRDDVPAVEEQIAWVAGRDASLGDQLRAELGGRLRDWQPVADLAAPFVDAAGVFARVPVRAGPDGLRRGEAGGAVVPTTVPSRGQVRVTAEFAGDWETGRELGVVVHHPGGGAAGADRAAGYEFVLAAVDPPAAADDAPPARGAEPSPPDFRRTGRHAELRIVRNQVVLTRGAVTLPRGPVRVRAEREGDRLCAQVNDLPELQFTDAVPLIGGDQTVLGLVWPAAAAVVRVRAEGSAVPPAASPLERADALYEAARFADALALYEAQANAGGEAAAEARCKAGLCLAGLNRPAEAARAFEAVLALPGDRWPVVAAAQLWLLRLRARQYTAADEVFAAVSVRFTADQLAQYVPAAVREELARSAAPPAISYLIPDPAAVPKLEAVVRVLELLRTDSALAGAKHQLVVALALTRDYARAAPAAERNFREALAASAAHPVSAHHLSWALRWHLWVLRAKGDLMAAAEAADAAVRDHPVRTGRGEWETREDRQAFVPFRLDQARCHAALGDWGRAEAAVDAYLRDCNTPAEHYMFYSQAYVMKGLLRSRRGDEAGAVAAWRRGTYAGFLAQLPAGGPPPALSPPGRWGVLEHWVMGSLADALPDADAAAVWAALAAQVSSDPLMSQAVGSLQVSPAVVRAAWRSPRSRALAERLAFLNVEPIEYVRSFPRVLVYEKLRQDLFAGRPTADQEAVAWDAVARGSDALFDGTMARPQGLQLALAWKGTAGVFGWGGVAPKLPPAARGPVAYVMGRRYRALDRPADAHGMFATAAADAPADSPLRRVADDELRALGGGK